VAAAAMREGSRCLACWNRIKWGMGTAATLPFVLRCSLFPVIRLYTNTRFYNPHIPPLCLSASDVSNRIQLKPSAWRRSALNKDAQIGCASGLRLAFGKGATEDPTLMFQRSEVKELWERLNRETSNSNSGEADERLLLISGPPGTGKSTAVWMWAGSVAVSSKVVWIHLGRSGEVQYVEMNSDSTRHAALNAVDWVSFFKSNVGDADVVILDGLIESEKKTAMSTLEAWQSNAGGSPLLIFVASEQIKLGGEDLRHSNRVSVCSWSLSEVFNACTDEAFWGQVSSNVNHHEKGGGSEHFKVAPADAKLCAISEKFALCGGSARWLFGMNWTEARRDIDGYVDRVSDPRVLHSAFGGAAAETAVNHIMGLEREGNKSVRTICSAYIQRALCLKFRKHLIEAAKNLGTVLLHPGFHGLILEADFCDRVMHSALLTVKSDVGADETWSAGCYVNFVRVEDLLGKVKRKLDGSEIRENIKSIKNGTWLFPSWNQGCYDAAQLLDGGVMRIVQVTIGKTHAMLVYFVSSLIQTLVALGFEIETIDFVILVPEGSERPKLATPVGDLRAWKWNVNMVRFLWLPRNAE